MIAVLRRLSVRILPGFVVALSFGAAEAPAESVKIHRKFDTKSKHYVERSTDIIQKISGAGMPGGGPMEIKMHQLFGVEEKVEDGKLGKKALTITFERARQSMDMPMMGNIEYDSDDPDNEEAAPQLSSLLKPMIGEKLTMEITRDGKVVNFAGMDAIAKKISENATANPLWMQQKQRFTDRRARKEWGEDPLRMYPNKEVNVGDSWESTSEDEDPQLGTILSKTKYKLEKLTKEDGRQIAEISYATDISKIKDGEGDTGRAKMEGKSSGKAFYDAESGLIVRQEGEGETKLKMPSQAGELDIVIVSKSTMRHLSEAMRKQQKEEMAAKIAERKKAEEAEDDEDDDGEDEDEEE